MNETVKRPTIQDVQIAAFEREAERRIKQKEANARKAETRKAAGLVSKSVPIHTSHTDFFDMTLKPMLNKYFTSSGSPEDSDWIKAKIEEVLAEISQREQHKRADDIQRTRPAPSQVSASDDDDPFGDVPAKTTGAE